MNHSHYGQTEKTTSFIIVFRPHQRPAWAQTFESEEQFVDCWVNGIFDKSCFANNNIEVSDQPNYDDAVADVGHDLNSLTRLDSAEEVNRYLNEVGYCGAHNKGYTAVTDCARELRWLDEEAEEAE